MSHRLFDSQVWHRRETPRVNEFSYKLSLLGIDLSSTESLQTLAPVLGYDRPGLFSIKNKDFLDGKQVNLLEALSRRGFSPGDTSDAQQVTLITAPRLLGYTFNPVSFYLLSDSGGNILSLLAEVNNTFGESHIYNIEAGPDGEFEFPKDFYVSPFFNTQGTYKLNASLTSERLEISIKLIKQGKVVFQAQLSGQGKPLTKTNLLFTLIKSPVTPWLTMIRISYQALRIHLLKKIGFVSKPSLCSPASFVRKPLSIYDKIRLFIVRYARKVDPIITSEVKR